MYSGTDNMLLNFISNTFAFICGVVLSITSTDILTTVSSPFTYTDFIQIATYLFKAVFSGFIALGIKYYGDILLMRYKEKKNKGGQQQ